jgi:uncharacterized protein (TIGR00251 family)
MAEARSREPHYWQGDTLVLNLLAQPRASQDQWLGRHGDAYKIRLAAAPVDGKANAQLVAFLAKCFGVSKSQVSLLAGASERRKRVAIESPRRYPGDLGRR